MHTKNWRQRLKGNGFIEIKIKFMSTIFIIKALFFNLIWHHLECDFSWMTFPIIVKV